MVRRTLSRISFLLNRCVLLARYYISGGSSAARMQGVVVGKNCRIYIWNFGTEPFLVEIGDRVTITSGVKLLTHDGATCLIRDEAGRRQRFARISIGSDVFIGVNSIVLPGVVIGSKCIVAAGSVVTKSVPDGSVVGGNPARFICSFDDYLERGLKSFVSDAELCGASSYRQRVLRAIEIAKQK